MIVPILSVLSCIPALILGMTLGELPTKKFLVAWASVTLLCAMFLLVGKYS